MRKFNLGDKVRYVWADIALAPDPHNNTKDWAGEDGLVLNEVYTVQGYSGSVNDSYPWFNVEERTNHNYVYQEWQFERAKLSNEERIAKRMEELQCIPPE